MVPSFEQLLPIGHVHSSQGVRGAVFIYLRAEQGPWWNQWKSLYLAAPHEEMKDLQVFQIRQKKTHQKQGKKGFVLDLIEIDNRDLAEALIGKTVWMPKDFFVSQKGETVYLREVLNFQVIDQARGAVGPVVGFSSNTAQDLLQIDRQGKVYEVPFVNAFLVRMDFEKKELHMDIPQGLLEEIE